MQMTPTIAVHLTAALGALALGPVALWARKGATQRPRLHRAAGYAWVALMVVTAFSAIFIRDYSLPNIAGYTPIHILVPVTFLSLVRAFRALARKDIATHRATMQYLYYGACVTAGIFTLLPRRYLGGLVWGAFGIDGATVTPASLLQGNTMIYQIVTHTPLWVWGLLAALLWLGLSQTVARTVGLGRVTILPLAMAGFSLYGTVSAFGTQPQAIAAYGLAAVAMAFFIMNRPLPAGVRYDAAARTFSMPGSWVPFALIMGAFTVKYVAGVAVGLNPPLARDATFALAMGLASGAVSGMFAARTARLLRLALRESRPSLAANAA